MAEFSAQEEGSRNFLISREKMRRLDFREISFKIDDLDDYANPGCLANGRAPRHRGHSDTIRPGSNSINARPSQQVMCVDDRQS
jgi:hypothetical protein